MRNIAALRRLEVDAYRMAFYVLQDEQLAVEATKTALLELGKNHRFHVMPDEEQNLIMKRTIISTTIHVKQQQLMVH